MPNILLRLSFLLHFFHSFILLLLPTKTKPHINNNNNNNNKPQIKNNLNLRRIFDSFDADKDGLITIQELSLSLKKMGIPITETDVAGLIDAADTNNDGCVDSGEFETLYAMLTSSSSSEAEHMKEAFGVFDRDGDGFISEEELKGVLDSLGICSHGRTLEDCRKMIQRVDVDGDGRVCFSEFTTMMNEVGFA